MRTSILAIAVLGVLAGSGPALAKNHRDDGAGPPRAILFVKDDFQGRSFMADRGYRKLGGVDMEDKISSIRVLSGTWQVCVDDDFGGRCEILDRSIRRLSDLHMDDKISSIRPVPRGGNWNR